MTRCANCTADHATIGMNNGDVLCTKCADILVTMFRGIKWKSRKLAERREQVLAASISAEFRNSPMIGSKPTGS